MSLAHCVSVRYLTCSIAAVIFFRDYTPVSTYFYKDFTAQTMFFFLFSYAVLNSDPRRKTNTVQ